RALLQRASHGSPRHQAVRRDRQINNGKGSTRLGARAGPGTAQPDREGATIFPEEYYPLIRVSSSLRSDEASLAVSIFGVCQRLPLLTGVSDNVVGVKHVVTTLPHALGQELHFRSVGAVLDATS